MMSEMRVKKWFVVMEWDNGARDELYGGDVPDCVTDEIENYARECEQYINEGWEVNNG